MKTIVAILLILLAILQYKLWIENDGANHASELRKQIAQQADVNQQLQERNQQLESEIKDLKQDSAAIEERARNDLGMVKKGEQYYQVIPKN